jgi:hypothetical protein
VEIAHCAYLSLLDAGSDTLFSECFAYPLVHEFDGISTNFCYRSVIVIPPRYLTHCTTIRMECQSQNFVICNPPADRTVSQEGGSETLLERKLSARYVSRSTIDKPVR